MMIQLLVCKENNFITEEFGKISSSRSCCAKSMNYKPQKPYIFCFRRHFYTIWRRKKIYVEVFVSPYPQQARSQGGDRGVVTPPIWGRGGVIFEPLPLLPASQIGLIYYYSIILLCNVYLLFCIHNHSINSDNF